MEMTDCQILLFYKYVNFDDPEQVLVWQNHLGQELDLKGRIIIAREGINATVEGKTHNINKYIRELETDSRFQGIHFKKSSSDGNSFPRFSIKIRDEIVSGHLDGQDIDPNQVTGKYLTPEQLHDWIHSGKRFYIVDMRNDYEHEVGFFKDSILPPLTNFRDLPQILPKLKHLADETVVTVCTGGVRCEKGSGFLITQGFKDVYQLHGGIVSYMEKYPNQDFLGTLYVFDNRVTMGFNLDSPDHVVVGKCVFCQNKAEKYYDCKYLHCQGKRHFVSCDKCIQKQKGFCTDCSQKFQTADLN